jgi:peptide chain release factor 3
MPPYQIARWIGADDPQLIEDFIAKNRNNCGEDLDGAPVYLAKSGWDINYAQEKNPKLRFVATKERQ